jgi:hypothetical protein
MCRVVEERVGEAALVYEDNAQTGVLRGDGTGKAGGTGADDENIYEVIGEAIGENVAGGFTHIVVFSLIPFLIVWMREPERRFTGLPEKDKVRAMKDMRRSPR